MFNELKYHFPNTWDILHVEFDSHFKSNFESGMEMVFESPITQWLVTPLIRDMADYFSKFEPINDSNLYVRFSDKIKNHLDDIIFSSLNYDLLFEHSSKEIG
ncbi:MAG: hypothetical protein L0H53_12575 [Candidatus Nitrosocosmicus sp.]|nr:hypothetical protein [Candidatus Nitrosocosmicus sp.]MDN5867943.1 hypothetical protein [Candidatus Nitrosocosmicus sp.]